jgi:hypothetical protein
MWGQNFELAEQREFAALPPKPEFLFEKVVDMAGLEDEWEFPIPVVESDESADKWDDEADESDDTLEPPMSVGPPALISGPSGRLSTLTLSPSIDIEAPTPCGISIAVENSDIVVLNRSSAIESVTTTDTVKRILSKPLEFEVKLSMRMRSTLMDIVWWVLLLVLGISFAIVWRRVV